MSDHEVISQHLKEFFRDQNHDARQRIPMGGPVGDIHSALSSIRDVLPDHDAQTRLHEWVPRAQQALAAERKRFRRENEDEAGWGAATFSELSSLLFGLLGDAS